MEATGRRLDDPKSNANAFADLARSDTEPDAALEGARPIREGGSWGVHPTE